jgi:Acyl-ACP thioesterase
MTLQNESQCTYACTVGMELLNGRGVMKPYGYQALIMDIAERHLRQFRLGVDDLLQKGMSWVLVSSSVEILQPVRAEMTLTARTWHSEQDRLTFRRELCFTDPQGQPVFSAATFSVLMDVRERRILRPDRLDFDIGQPHSEFLIEASPKLHCKGEMLPCDRRRVYPSCIDRLGHTNNCRYPEFAYDALTEGEISALANMRRMDVYFKSELKPGEYFTVRRSAAEVLQGELIVDGIHEETGRQAFICRFRSE